MSRMREENGGKKMIPDEKTIDETLQLVKTELIKAYRKFPENFHSTHEGYAVILEELDEMWDDIKRNLPMASCVEAIQVAAMAVKYIISIRG